MAPGDLFLKISKAEEGLPWWLLEAKNLPTMQPGFYPWVGKIPWRRKCNPLQYSCLENLMDGRAWQATVHGVPESQTRLSGFTSLHLVP